MAGLQDFIVFEEDFLGAMTLPTSASAHCPWVITDTSSAGTPTYVVDASSNGGSATMTFDNTSEVQNVCLSFGDKLTFDIDKIVEAEFCLKTVATADTATSLTWGLWGSRNDTIDSVAYHAHFRIIGSNSIVVESDDGVTDNDDKSTGTTLVAAYKKFVISFAKGTSDVRFYIDGSRVASSTTFDMDQYTGSLQPVVQLQKTADTNTDSVTIDYIRVLCRR